MRDGTIEHAAAYITGLIRGRDDVEAPDHPVWQHLEHQYKESYVHRARKVIELSGVEDRWGRCLNDRYGVGASTPDGLVDAVGVVINVRVTPLLSALENLVASFTELGLEEPDSELLQEATKAITLEKLKNKMPIVCMDCQKLLGWKDGGGVPGATSSLCRECWQKRCPGHPCPENSEEQDYGEQPRE